MKPLISPRSELVVTSGSEEEELIIIIIIIMAKESEDEVDTDCLYCAGDCLYCAGFVSEGNDSLEREVYKVGTHGFCELSEKGL